MLKRIITAVIGLPLVVLAVTLGGLFFLVPIIIISIIGLHEFYTAFNIKHTQIISHLYGTIFLLFAYLDPSRLFLGVAIFVVAINFLIVFLYNKISLKDIIIILYGFFYIPFLLGFLILIRESNFLFIWLVFISCFGCDTFAYFTGTLIGRRKLVNSPSPSKSIEGLIGGVIGATLLGLLFGLYFDMPIIAVITCFFGAIFSIIGDLSASAIKRHTGIKDFGSIFPGHGGVVDRLDSILMVAPVVYIVTLI